jgi:hypothetical protein
VAATAELGQEQCDVEDAGQDSTRLVGRRRGSEWHVGEGSGAGLHGGGLRGSDGEVCCTGVREHTGRRRATWPSEERLARGREAAGQRPERHVHGRRGVRERQRRRTWLGSGETEEGEREVDEGDPNAISEKCRDLSVMHQ